MKPTIATVLLLVMACGSCCQRGHREDPVVRVRMPVLRSHNRFTTARVASPVATLGQSIQVTVGGEVCSGGRYVVPAGTSVLQAIVKAGGFTSFASPYKRLELHRGGEVVRLMFREARVTGARPGFGGLSGPRRLVWYVAAHWNPESQSWVPEEPLQPADVMLQDGDVIQVPRSGS